MDLLEQYPDALAQLEILKKDYLGVDSEADTAYNSNVETDNEG